MRWLCFIFAVFFLCMDLEPCKDRIGIANTNTPLTIASGHAHRSTPVQDQCPPMCHCGCCSMQVVIAQKLILQTTRGITVPTQVIFVPEKPVTRPTNIWQPPKLTA